MRPSAPSRRSATKAAPSRRPSAARSDVSLYDEVTGKIIAQLEAGRFPWVQPWGRPRGPALALPRNGLTGRRYSGVNILLLWGAVIEQGHPSQGWVTFRQALAAGGAVRRGEHGTTVVFADRFTPKAEQERAARDGDEPGQVAFLKRFKVFNLAQCEGLEGLDKDPAPVPERQVVPVAEALIAATGADFRIGGARAYYAPALDYVRVPPQPAFTDQINYYRTAFHELTHWTGHPSRLARDQSGPHGGKAYGREELVAELGAAFVCASLGITPTVRHADYLGAWLETLREDNRAIFRAASQASKAADLLLSFQADPGPPPAQTEALAAPLAVSQAA
ncbi:zincin-like metallopeptidase domain-containing protein [Caulobacter segnis]|uniref:ArdC family protein n=1 Tax=Caulobacter segnis TaxID=88688 RepID=UPI00285DBB4C|nr:zincin-like metallopeptidase domain-containing protein [Caulobacter segnis]MDR6623829.1 antirestriction protein ArdC [Caulobacter segnis]